MLLFLILIEYKPTQSQHDFYFTDFLSNIETNCTDFNSSDCNFCTPGTIYNASKFIKKSILFIFILINKKF